MGGTQSAPVIPPRRPVPAGKTRICIAGYTMSHHTGRARTIAALIASTHPAEYETWFYFDSHRNFESFLKITFDPVPFPPHLKGHGSSPFVWLETGDNVITPIGGRGHFCDWVRSKFPSEQAILREARDPSLLEAFHNGKGAPQSTADVSQ